MQITDNKNSLLDLEHELLLLFYMQYKRFHFLVAEKILQFLFEDIFEFSDANVESDGRDDPDNPSGYGPPPLSLLQPGPQDLLSPWQLRQLR